MSQAPQYPIVEQLKQVSAIADISVEKVLRRAGLPIDFAEQPSPTVDAEKYFMLWDALGKELESPDSILNIGLTYAHGPFVSPIFAFSCSETVETGLARLAQFKPLLGPVALTLEKNDGSMTLTIKPQLVQRPMPVFFSLFELIYLTECTRIYTGEHIVPLAATCSPSGNPSPAVLDHLGIEVTESQDTQIVFAEKDSQLPLLTRNETLWNMLEPNFQRQLKEQQNSNSTSSRVKAVIVDTLASGGVSSEQVASKLYTSRRSLQRRLSEEGETFQKILTQTRMELSEHYLSQPELSLAEISYLLGFQDQTSFFRAHQSWTGNTPVEARRAVTKLN